MSTRNKRPGRTAAVVATAANEELANASNDVEVAAASTEPASKTKAPRGRKAPASSVTNEEPTKQPASSTPSTSRTKRGTKKEAIEAPISNAGDKVEVEAEPAPAITNKRATNKRGTASKAASQAKSQDNEIELSQPEPAPKTNKRGATRKAAQEKVPDEEVIEVKSTTTRPKRGVRKVYEELDDDVEEEEEEVPIQTPRSGRRTKASTEIKSPTKKSTPVKASPAKAAPKPKRGQNKKVHFEEIEEVDEPEEKVLEAPAPATGRAKRATTTKATTPAKTTSRTRSRKASVEEESAAPTIVPPAPSASKAKPTRGGRGARKAEPEQEESEPMEVDQQPPTKRAPASRSRKRVLSNSDATDTVDTSSEPAEKPLPLKKTKLASTEESVVDAATTSEPITTGRRAAARTNRKTTEPIAENKSNDAVSDSVTVQEPIAKPTSTSRSRRGAVKAPSGVSEVITEPTEPVKPETKSRKATTKTTSASAASDVQVNENGDLAAAVPVAQSSDSVPLKPKQTRRGAAAKVKVQKNDSTPSNEASAEVIAAPAIEEPSSSVKPEPSSENDSTTAAKTSEKLTEAESATSDTVTLEPKAEDTSKSTKLAHKPSSKEEKPKLVSESSDVELTSEVKLEEEKPVDETAEAVNEVSEKVAPSIEQKEENKTEEKPTVSTFEVVVEDEPQIETQIEPQVDLPKDDDDLPMESELTEGGDDLTISEQKEEDTTIESKEEEAAQSEPIVTFPSELGDAGQSLKAEEKHEPEDVSEVNPEETNEGLKSTENEPVVDLVPEVGPVTQNGNSVEEPISESMVIDEVRDQEALANDLPPDTNNNDDNDSSQDAHANLKRKISMPDKYEKRAKRPRFQWSTGDLFTLGEALVGETGPREKLYNELKIRKNQPGRVKLHEKVRQVVCGAFHTLVITEEGQVVTFGCNDDGALGRITTKPEDDDEASDSDGEDDYETKMSSKPLPVGGDIKAKVIKVSTGDMHSAALDENGNVFIWGNLKDESNRFGLFLDDIKEGSEYLATVLPRQIDMEGKKVVDIASGCHHFLMLTEDGQLFSMGEGSKGQLGRIDVADLETVSTKRELFIKPQPVKFAEPVTISRIFARQWSSFAISEQGNLYAWGLNNNFQLGFRTENPVQFDQNTSLNAVASLNAELYPVRVQTPETMSEVVAVSCGQQHVAVLDIDGHIFTCGNSTYGKLGHGKEFVDECGDGQCIDTLKQIDPDVFGNDRITYIECGDFSTFAITETGRLYAWGQGSKGIGTDQGQEEHDRFEPTLITSAYGNNVRYFTGGASSSFSGWIGSLHGKPSN